MTMISRRKFLLTSMVGTVGLSTTTLQTLAQSGHAHDHGATVSKAGRDLGLGAAFDNEGRLWVVSKETANEGQYVVVQSSADMGKTWTPPVRVQKSPEPVAASGEARPHIAFGSKGEIYISYTSTVARPHIGDIRFVRSLDGGKTFSEPSTVHANREFITHSFESVAVDKDGRIYVAWIDGRDAEKAKERQERYAGSAVYYAVSSDQGATFRGDYKVADHSCECCRIGIALNPQGRPVAFWRHVFSPNIRDHAIAELRPDGTVSAASRATFDDWRVDACPHHGPSIAFGPDGTRHQVWFNGTEGPGGGALYAVATSEGKLGNPKVLGTGQSSHPDVAVRGRQVAVAWKEFDGKSTSIVSRLSQDGGATWTQKRAATTSGNSDKPYLITSPARIALVWRTQDEGVRVIPLGKERT